MKYKLAFYIFGILVVVLGVTGCRTPEYYQEQSVIKAREFLLKKAPDLTIEQSSFVKFNRPAILYSSVLGSPGNPEASMISSDLSQIAISWQIPGKDELFMVWGVCSTSMRNYYPERLIRRKITLLDKNRSQAVESARRFVLDNLFLSISVEDYNFLRYAEPEIKHSKFSLDNTENSAKNMHLFTADKFEIPANSDQYTIFWRSKAGKDVIAVIGYAGAKLADFVPMAGGEIEEVYLNENLIQAPDAEKEAVK